MKPQSKEETQWQEDQVLRMYSRLVSRAVRPFYLSGGDCEDLYQEGMIGLLHAVRTFDPSRCVVFEAYASLCIRSRILDAVRKQKNQAHTVASDEQLEVFAERSADDRYLDPEAEVLANESAKEINSALSGLLSPFEASVLDSYLQGYTASEIAGEIGRPVKSVDNAIWRIRRKLALFLSQGRQQE